MLVAVAGCLLLFLFLFLFIFFVRLQVCVALAVADANWHVRNLQKGAVSLTCPCPGSCYFKQGKFKLPSFFFVFFYFIFCAAD